MAAGSESDANNDADNDVTDNDDNANESEDDDESSDIDDDDDDRENEIGDADNFNDDGAIVGDDAKMNGEEETEDEAVKTVMVTLGGKVDVTSLVLLTSLNEVVFFTASVILLFASGISNDSEASCVGTKYSIPRHSNQ